MDHLSDIEFETRFSDCTLDPKYFTHAGHIRLAWIHIRKYGLATAIENICAQIKRYDMKFGDGTKFHKTLTVAAVSIVHHFIEKSDSDTFSEFIALHPRLITHFREMITAHYSKDVLLDNLAKTQYLEPDLLPFYG